MQTTHFIENDADLERVVEVLRQELKSKKHKVFGLEVIVCPITDDSEEFDHLLDDAENIDILMD